LNAAVEFIGLFIWEGVEGNVSTDFCLGRIEEWCLMRGLPFNLLIVQELGCDAMLVHLCGGVCGLVLVLVVRWISGFDL